MPSVLKIPFHTREYASYNEYLTHQKSKLDNGISWLEKYEKTYYVLLIDWLKSTKLQFEGMSSLCVGARTGTEVKVFNDLGSFSVGIDINPGKENKFVVWGDASDIQYADNTVDIVYTNSLDHFLKIEESISEMCRVLKPKGYFILLINSPEDSKKDTFGSVHWDDVQDVLDYFTVQCGFTITRRKDISFSNFFSDFVVMVNNVEA